MYDFIAKKLGYDRKEASWIFYDIANSEFILMTATVIFPLLMSYISTDRGSAYVGWANTIYALILAVLAPILGTVADYQGYKKKFFKFFLFLGICGGMVMTIPTISAVQATIIYIVTMVGYGGANVFYDAFLIDVTEESRYNKISSAGYGWGYVGSAVPFLLFVIPFAVVTLFGGESNSIMIGGFELTYRYAMSLSMILAALWWLVMSFPMLRNVEQRYYRDREAGIVAKSFVRLATTFKNIQRHRNIFIFCLAYFFYIDVVNSVITMAVALATDMGVSPAASLGVIIMVQFVAFPSALIYGMMATKFGEKRMIFLGIAGYLVVIFLGSSLAANPNMIWALGFVVGLFQGGIQAISRSFFTKLIPEKKDTNEFFGFFSIFSKFSAILGPLAISVVVTFTGNAGLGIIALIPILVVGAILLAFVQNPQS